MVEKCKTMDYYVNRIKMREWVLVFKFNKEY